MGSPYTNRREGQTPSLAGVNPGHKRLLLAASRKRRKKKEGRKREKILLTPGSGLHYKLAREAPRFAVTGEMGRTSNPFNFQCAKKKKGGEPGNGGLSS